LIDQKKLNTIIGPYGKHMLTEKINNMKPLMFQSRTNCDEAVKHLFSLEESRFPGLDFDCWQKRMAKTKRDVST